MSQFDELWDRLVESGALNFDQMGRARARFIEAAGGICTAIIETVALEAETLEQVLASIAESLGLRVAPLEWVEAPDLEVLARIPRSLLMEYGVVPVRNDHGQLVLVTPPHAPHMLERLREEIALEAQLYIGLEVDLRHTLQSYAQLEPAERFHLLWTGNCPSALKSGDMPAWSALSGQLSQVSGVCGVTRPGRPRALGMADTDELRPNVIASHWQDTHHGDLGLPNDTETPLEGVVVVDDMGPIRSEADTVPP